jgi:hypothetical protein
MQSDKTGRHQDAGSLLTLFRLTYDEHLERVTTNDLRITPMQGMYRSAGPVLE